MKLAKSHWRLFLPCFASDHELLFLRDVSWGGPCGGWKRSLSTEGICQGATATARHHPGSSLPSGLRGQPVLPVGFMAPWHVGTKSSPATEAAMAAMPTPIALFSPKVTGLLPVPVKATAQSDTLLRLEDFPGAVLVFPLSCCLSHTSPLQLFLRLLSLPAFLPLWQVEKTDSACGAREGVLWQTRAGFRPGARWGKAPGLSWGGIWPAGERRHGECIRRVTSLAASRLCIVTKCSLIQKQNLRNVATLREEFRQSRKSKGSP